VPIDVDTDLPQEAPSLPVISRGEIAALGAACCWTVSSLAFESASKRVGALSVNVLRLGVALVFLSLYTWIARGLILPLDASSRTWLWLPLSGLVGFTLGDLCLFRAYVLVGARLTMLVMSLVPPFTALVGWAALNERLGATEWLGMAITVAGVAWVVMERPSSDASSEARTRIRGLSLGLVATVGQAVGLIMSKHGMGAYDPFAATQIRIAAGLVGFAGVVSVARRWPRVGAALLDRPALARLSLGAVFGPFIGVSLSLMAVQHTATGIAATLMAIVPVLIIPPAVLVFKERVSLRAVAGAIVAVGGVALMVR
jgi:drug/metabolite transporter (DMT)-like permease